MQGLSPQGDAKHPFGEERDGSAGTSRSVAPEGLEDTVERTQPESDEEQEKPGQEQEEKPVPRRGVKFADDDDSDFEEDEEEESAAIESAIQRIAFDLANEMIQKALETFPSESVKELVPGAEGGELKRHPSIKKGQFDPSVSPLDEAYEGEGETSATGPYHGEESAESPAPEAVDHLTATEDDAAKEAGYEVETEYLRDMEMRVNRYSRESNVIETDANKEVVESTSFRKISGQENQSVQGCNHTPPAHSVLGRPL
nr:hypothetical protein BaRGS_012189 [Batillaria attramentaria]